MLTYLKDQGPLGWSINVGRYDDGNNDKLEGGLGIDYHFRKRMTILSFIFLHLYVC